MTHFQLLSDLKEFIADATKGMLLPCRGQVDRPPGIYIGRSPDKKAGIKQIPYIILQLLTGTDEREDINRPQSICIVRIVIAVYSEEDPTNSDDNGFMQVLHLIDTLRLRLESEGTVSGHFLLQYPFEFRIYEDDTQEYYLGEIITRWELPAVKREVNYYDY